ncbi:hypothetical protein PPACK8108_LOCUS2754 [Phakopsora pachyrhizi]|uniref:Uncharacterized protein n=1 Tax=Phakopsora pachyrhizi TaxID=170000 RepID=A0AAV0AIL5_PHAPC|nr:hypothetical protein PPACK8108_LOCUS2754 [Phakopsora pachyrhizi]
MNFKEAPDLEDGHGRMTGGSGAVVEEMVKEAREKAGAERGFCWISQDFEVEGVAVEESEWRHWKEEQKLGRSGWSKTTGVMDL